MHWQFPQEGTPLYVTPWISYVALSCICQVGAGTWGHLLRNACRSVLTWLWAGQRSPAFSFLAFPLCVVCLFFIKRTTTRLWSSPADSQHNDEVDHGTLRLMTTQIRQNLCVWVREWHRERKAWGSPFQLRLWEWIIESDELKITWLRRGGAALLLLHTLCWSRGRPMRARLLVCVAQSVYVCVCVGCVCWSVSGDRHGSEGRVIRVC